MEYFTDSSSSIGQEEMDEVAPELDGDLQSSNETSREEHPTSSALSSPFNMPGGSKRRYGRLFPVNNKNNEPSLRYITQFSQDKFCIWVEILLFQQHTEVTHLPENLMVCH